MEQRFHEDAMMVARNILSGKNACGTLQAAVASNDLRYFAAAADAVLKVKRDELEFLRGQRDAARSDIEKYRFALELMVQNMIPSNTPAPGGMFLPRNENIHSMLEQTLGRSISWDTG